MHVKHALPVHGGIIPELVTPLDAQGHVDKASVERLVEFQIRRGVHALFVLGSTSASCEWRRTRERYDATLLFVDVSRSGAR
jgi:dihydrodipicolinate synthase/N-acetylneuraminate lyase